MNIRIVGVTEENLPEHPQVICYINPKNQYYHLKIEWLKNRFSDGLRIKLLYIEGEKRSVGYIEYVPGECCWRAVSAKEYMFVHCLWTYGKKNQNKGPGQALIEEVEKDAGGLLGVATVTSEKPFMANSSIFLKNGYEIIEESGKDQLLVKSILNGPLPSINDWESELSKYKALTIIYSRQCPWVARLIEEIRPILHEKRIEPNIVEIDSYVKAQRAPSLYSGFNPIFKGKFLADRYVSPTRFKNILKKELFI